MNKKDDISVESLSKLEEPSFEVSTIFDEKVDDKTKMTLNEYLCNFSQNHAVDIVIYGWVLKKKISKSDKKTKSGWNSLVKEFFSEKEMEE